jgi:hypothetical protein
MGVRPVVGVDFKILLLITPAGDVIEASSKAYRSYILNPDKRFSPTAAEHDTAHAYKYLSVNRPFWTRSHLDSKGFVRARMRISNIDLYSLVPSFESVRREEGITPFISIAQLIGIQEEGYDLKQMIEEYFSDGGDVIATRLEDDYGDDTVDFPRALITMHPAKDWLDTHDFFPQHPSRRTYITVYTDENGEYKNLPPNLLGSFILGQPVVGTIALELNMYEDQTRFAGPTVENIDKVVKDVIFRVYDLQSLLADSIINYSLKSMRTIVSSS